MSLFNSLFGKSDSTSGPTVSPQHVEAIFQLTAQHVANLKDATKLSYALILPYLLRSSASMMIRSHGLAFAKSYYAKSLQDLSAPPDGISLRPVENFRNPEPPGDQQAMFNDFTKLMDHMTNDLLSRGLDPLDIGYAYFKFAIEVATKTDGYYAAGLIVACARELNENKIR